MQTDTLRLKIKNLRNQMDSESVSTLSQIITKKVLNLDNIKSLHTFMVYKSFRNEVATQGIIDGLLSLGKTICYPVTFKDKMIAALPLSNEFTVSKLGVLEPKEYIALDRVDAVIVPMIACDKNKNRIGFGKGYYDKFLSNNSALKIGVCYEFQVVDKIETNPWDIPLDIIVTEINIF